MAKRASEISSWLEAGFKGLIAVIFTISCFFFNQLNNTMKDLSSAIKVVEQHQIEADKRIQAIEVSREINMASYTKLVADVQDMKATMIQNTMRLQTISDFIAGNFKPAHK